ncbi:MAG: NADH:ubiquinone oxidoreductase subunit RnfE [Oscillospiraceae bacterium]|nr:NADH:ubiquinone oxidoreductase subunit RnfE [Oscillospiraceae bacterium]
MKKSKFSVSADGLLRQNIVLMSGLVTAPVIVAATSVERAAVLVVSFFLISYTSILLCRFIPRKIVYTVRILLYAVVAAVMYIPTALCIAKLFPNVSSGVMLYVELLVVNSFLLAKTETRFYLKPYGEMVLDAFIYVIGYAVVAFLVGVLREVLAYGTVCGFHLCEPVVPAAKSPFFGFILVGIMAAVCRGISGKRAPRKERGV